MDLGSRDCEDVAAARLSPRECASLQLLGRGLPRKEVAHRLGVSENTLKKFIARARLKLGAMTIEEAVASHAAAHRACARLSPILSPILSPTKTRKRPV